MISGEGLVNRTRKGPLLVLFLICGSEDGDGKVQGFGLWKYGT